MNFKNNREESENILFENYKDIVGVEDLCDMLGVGKNTAYKLINRGDIKSLRIGKIHKIPKRYIIDYLERAC